MNEGDNVKKQKFHAFMKIILKKIYKMRGKLGAGFKIQFLKKITNLSTFFYIKKAQDLIARTIIEFL